MSPVLAILAFALAAHTGDAYSVVAVPAPYDFVSGDITQICGRSTLGCTEIVDVDLRSTCTKRGDEEWAPEPEITFGALIHLPGLADPGEIYHVLLHELEHIKDIHRDAERYARDLAGRRFTSLNDCIDTTLQEKDEFNGRIRLFAQQSVKERR
jgi:hypothetical protein